MKDTISDIRAALLSTLLLALVCCGLYPVAVWAVAQLALDRQANGSLIVASHGVVRGSSLIGQPFANAGNFHPRPSAAGNGYDAANSGGSNLGPTSRKLSDSLRERGAAYRAENGLHDNAPVPADAVTASASGLDPHISVSNARLQVPRVAKARRLPEARVREILEQHIEPPDLGLLGEPRVNVLMLNMALENP